MSNGDAAEPPGAGVVRNSALSFLASAHAEQQDEQDKMSQSAERPVASVPAGLQALCEAYSGLYPDQPNPLQVTTRLKYWLGGHDPLDYISMYWIPGNPQENIPPHWHYVSFGLSDLHGDGRVHPPPDRVLLAEGAPTPSGYGFELTFRLSQEADSPVSPPLWPAALLQALARYVFTTGNKFCAGDHISWHAPLDGSPPPPATPAVGPASSPGVDAREAPVAQRTRVRHLLVADDVRLKEVRTPHGTVGFLQMVGCTGRELRAAQRGSGFEVLQLIADDPDCGGPWLVTRVRRSTSARALARRCISSPAPPATLAGVSARLRWQAYPRRKESAEETTSPSELSPRVEQQIKETLQRGLSSMSTDRTGPEGHTGMSTDSFEMSSIERALPQIPELMQGSWRGVEDNTEYLDGVHLFLNAEGASLLPLAIDGRVLHDRHFTWRCGPRAVTVLSPKVGGAFADAQRPYVVRGMWLQMVIPKDLALDMSRQVSRLSRLADTDSESGESGTEDCEVPLTLAWPKHRLKISVVCDDELL